MDTEMLTCPITGERMKDPVVDPEGNTYEREAILNWLSRQHTSPITRSPLQPQDLVPNRALAQLLNSCAPQSGSQTSAGSSAPADASAVSNRLSAINFQEPPPPPPFQPEIKAVHTTDGTVHIKLNMSSSSTDCTHAPSTIICVIDISYSMDSRATMPGDEEGSSGLSLLVRTDSPFP